MRRKVSAASSGKRVACCRRLGVLSAEYDVQRCLKIKDVHKSKMVTNQRCLQVKPRAQVDYRAYRGAGRKWKKTALRHMMQALPGVFLCPRAVSSYSASESYSGCVRERGESVTRGACRRTSASLVPSYGLHTVSALLKIRRFVCFVPQNQNTAKAAESETVRERDGTREMPSCRNHRRRLCRAVAITVVVCAELSQSPSSSKPSCHNRRRRLC
jgi:hypothetical protein